MSSFRTKSPTYSGDCRRGVLAVLRVVSLVPSATESVLAWGVTPVACTRFCEQPTLRHIGGTKDPNIAEIVALQPDLVLCCEEENLKAHHDELVAAGLRTFTFRVDSVSDVASQLEALAGCLGLETSNLAGCGADAVPNEQPPTPVLAAFVPIWRRPTMTMSGGTYGSSLLASVGVLNVFADAVIRYPEVTADEVAERRPDVILAPTEPYPFKDRHLRALTEELGAPAVLVDGADLFWWGTRSAAAQVRLAAQVRQLAFLKR